jgi:Bacterial Ig-like domain
LQAQQSSDADGILQKGETTTLNFDFSEADTGFTAADISISPKLGTLGAALITTGNMAKLTNFLAAYNKTN